MAILEAALVAMIALTGSHWVASDNMHQTVQFKDQQVFGNAGCNHFSGAYTQSHAVLTVSLLATTRKACAPDVMLQESWFIQQLQKTKTAKIEGDFLILKSADGQTLLRFNRKEQG